MKLNLGCGHRPRDGYVNVDVRAGPGVDRVLDIDGTELPWETGSVEKVRLIDVIEHLVNPYETLVEIARILEPQGWLIVQYPHVESVKARIVTHTRTMDEHSLDPVIRGRHLPDSSLEHQELFVLSLMNVTHKHPWAYHQRKYLGREVLAWGKHNVKAYLVRTEVPVG